MIFNVIRVWEHSDSLGPLDAITAVGRKTSSQIGLGSLSAADRENEGNPRFTRAKGQAGSSRLDLEHPKSAVFQPSFSHAK